MSETIRLKHFLSCPDSFTKKIPLEVNQCMPLDDQKSYLTTIFRQQNDVFRPTLRKIHNNITHFEVHEGWQYVDTLIRFFKNEIPLPYDVITLFPNSFSPAEVNMMGMTNNKPYADADFYHHNLNKYKEFREFVDNAVVNVIFIK